LTSAFWPKSSNQSTLNPEAAHVGEDWADPTDYAKNNKTPADNGIVVIDQGSMWSAN
jgi:hypothetical protein